jgi:hypothetical protein
MRSQVRNRPLDRVLDTLPFMGSRDPHLKVLDAVVVLHAVLVMDCLVVLQRTAEVLLHYFSVLKNAFMFTANGETAQHVSLRVLVPFAFRLSHAPLRASFRAVFRVFVAGYAEVFTALRTISRFENSLGFRGVLASVRTEAAPVPMASLRDKLRAATRAIHRDGRGSFDSSGSLVDARRHFLSPFGTGIAIVPEFSTGCNHG